jgi:hypothetical protein
MTLTTTVDAACDRARRDSLLTARGPVFTVSAGYTSADTILVLNEPFTHIGVGEILAINYELLYVQSATPATNTVTVIRGYLGTTPAAINANDFIEVAAPYPKAQFIDSAYHEILSWSKKLFRVTPLDVALTVGQANYPLGNTGPVDFILDIRLDPLSSSATQWAQSWTADRKLSASARLIRGPNPTDIEIQFTRLSPATTTARVMVAQPFDLSTFTPTTDLVADVGLDPAWLDLLETGMKWRALSSSVIGRTDWRTSNLARQAEEVTPLDVVRSASHLRDLRETKLSDAMMQLRADWPYRER